jgi:hypothetical protein
LANSFNISIKDQKLDTPSYIEFPEGRVRHRRSDL